MIEENDLIRAKRNGNRIRYGECNIYSVQTYMYLFGQLKVWSKFSRYENGGSLAGFLVGFVADASLYYIYL